MWTPKRVEPLGQRVVGIEHVDRQRRQEALGLAARGPEHAGRRPRSARGEVRPARRDARQLRDEAIADVAPAGPAPRRARRAPAAKPASLRKSAAMPDGVQRRRRPLPRAGRRGAARAPRAASRTSAASSSAARAVSSSAGDAGCTRAPAQRLRACARARARAQRRARGASGETASSSARGLAPGGDRERASDELGMGAQRCGAREVRHAQAGDAHGKRAPGPYAARRRRTRTARGAERALAHERDLDLEALEQRRGSGEARAARAELERELAAGARDAVAREHDQRAAAAGRRAREPLPDRRERGAAPRADEVERDQREAARSSRRRRSAAPGAPPALGRPHPEHALERDAAACAEAGSKASAASTTAVNSAAASPGPAAPARGRCGPRLRARRSRTGVRREAAARAARRASGSPVGSAARCGSPRASAAAPQLRAEVAQHGGVRGGGTRPRFSLFIRSSSSGGTGAAMQTRRPRQRRRPSANRRIASGTSRRSTSCTRAASVSGVSSSRTGTASCRMIGPWSYSSSAKCTVAPVSFTPDSSTASCTRCP